MCPRFCLHVLMRVLLTPTSPPLRTFSEHTLSGFWRNPAVSGCALYTPPWGPKRYQQRTLRWRRHPGTPMFSRDMRSPAVPDRNMLVRLHNDTTTGVSMYHTRLSQHVAVEHFEELVKAELAETLHGVADERRRPAPAQTPEPVLPHGHGEAVKHGLVFTWIYLEQMTHDAHRTNRQTFWITSRIRTCMRHLTRSRGTTTVCVSPQLRTPPKPHRA